MRVVLNGHTYELAPDTGVQRQPIVEFPGNTRQQGQQTREDRALMSSWPFGDFAFGSGIERMDLDQERDKQSWWKSTVDTRWRGKVFLPPLLHETIVGSSAIGTIHGLPMMMDDGVNAFLGCIIPSAANRVHFGLANFSAVGSDHFEYNQPIVPDGTTSGITLLKQMAHEPEEDKYYFYVSKADAAGIMTRDRAISANPTLNTDTRGTGFTNDQYECSKFYRHVGTMHIGGLDKIKDKAFVHPLLTGTYEEDTDVFQHDAYLPPQLAHTPDGLFIGGSRGVYLLNLVQRTYTEKKDLSHYPSFYNCLDMCAWGNEYLMVPYREPVAQGGMSAFNTVDNLDIRIGMDIDDGVPSGWTPEVVALLPTPDFVFAACPRPVSSYAGSGSIVYRESGHCRVFAYDGYGWHYMTQLMATGPNNDIVQLLPSHRGDGVPRLWMVPTGAGTLACHGPSFIKYPMSHPLEQDGYVFATQGNLRLPIFNGGMPEYKGSFFDFVLEADELGSGRQIEVFYGLNGAEPTLSLGVATVDGTRILPFGSGLGVEGYSIQLDLQFTRGADSSKSPVLITHHSPLLHYMKFPSKRETYTFTIDLGNTKKSTQKPHKASLDNLSAVASSNVLVPFFYGHVATKNVKLVSMTSVETSDDRIFMGDPSGFVEVVLAELL